MQTYLIMIYLQLVKLKNTTDFHLTWTKTLFQSQRKHTLHSTYNGLIFIWGPVFILLQQMIMQTKISKSKLV